MIIYPTKYWTHQLIADRRHTQPSWLKEIKHPFPFKWVYITWQVYTLHTSNILSRPPHGKQNNHFLWKLPCLILQVEKYTPCLFHSHSNSKQKKFGWLTRSGVRISHPKITGEPEFSCSGFVQNCNPNLYPVHFFWTFFEKRARGFSSKNDLSSRGVHEIST